MSGIVGSITAISKEFNDLDNNTIKGIKTANYFNFLLFYVIILLDKKNN